MPNQHRESIATPRGFQSVKFKNGHNRLPQGKHEQVDKFIFNIQGTFFGPLRSDLLVQRAAGTSLHDVSAHTGSPRVDISQYLDSLERASGWIDSTVLFDAAHPDALLGLWRESILFTGPLRLLQGSVVPHWEGVWATVNPHTETEVYTTLYENHPSLDHEAVKRMTMEEKFLVLRKYRKLHAAGVIHGSARPRNWRRKKRHSLDDVLLYNFRYATQRTDYSVEDNFWRAADDEIMFVCSILGLPKEATARFDDMTL